LPEFTTMKSRTEILPTGPARPALAICIAFAFSGAATLAQAAGPVKPPPLPPGSEMVRIQGGMNDDEVKRETRAHHHKGHVRKDFRRDDSVGGNGRSGNDRDGNNGGGQGRR
jgi:hypothetical protein